MTEKSQKKVLKIKKPKNLDKSISDPDVNFSEDEKSQKVDQIMDFL